MENKNSDEENGSRRQAANRSNVDPTSLASNQEQAIVDPTTLSSNQDQAIENLSSNQEQTIANPSTFDSNQDQSVANPTTLDSNQDQSVANATARSSVPDQSMGLPTRGDSGRWTSAPYESRPSQSTRGPTYTQETRGGDPLTSWETYKQQISLRVSTTKKSGEQSIGEQFMVVQWSNLRAAAFLPKRRAKKGQPPPPRIKVILHGVSGVAVPGTLTALMGASGAGKTTLLNILNRTGIKQLRVEGNVLVNGRAISPTVMSRISGFVQQEDLFLGTLRVREHLIFHANLRMKNCTKEEKLQRIEEVMKSVGLKKCEHSIIGIPGELKGISGGEAKRLSFAAELLTDPMLLFCDEPTSGLDSFMAQTVVGVLKKMAREGKTIVSTIHQPSSETFAMFDRLYLLGEGRLCFCGCVDDAAEFFDGMGFPCPKNYNLADHLIHTLAVVPGEEDFRRKRVRIIASSFESSTYGNKYRELIKDANRKPFPRIERIYPFSLNSYQTSPANQYIWLMYRTFKKLGRDPFFLLLKLVEALVLALFLGCLYYQTIIDSNVMQNYSGVVFFLLTDIFFDTVYGVVEKFPLSFPLLQRDHVAGLYSPTIYYFSQVTASLVIGIAIVTVRVFVTFWMVGFKANQGSQFELFCWFILVYEISMQTTIAYGYLISCIGGSLEWAIALANPFMLIPMLFAGYFIIKDSIPLVLRWMRWFSFFYYGFEALSILLWRAVQRIPSRCVNDNMTLNYHQVLDLWSYHEQNLCFDILMLVVLMVVYHVLAVILLNIRQKRR